VGSFRFLKTKQLMPGVRLNLNKRSVGMTFGLRGLRYTVNSSGRRRTSVGLPGNGLWYRAQKGGGRSHSSPWPTEGSGDSPTERVLPSEEEIRATFLSSDYAQAEFAELEQRPDEEVFAELAAEIDLMSREDPQMLASRGRAAFPTVCIARACARASVKPRHSSVLVTRRFRSAAGRDLHRMEAIAGLR
jgi:uncharacterized protein DUF4236